MALRAGNTAHAALRSFRASTTTTTPAIATTQQRYAIARGAILVARRHLSTEKTPERPPSNEEKLGRTFSGQMMGSIQQRLRKEKEDRERFAREREKTASSRNWYFTFSLVAASGIAYYLGTLLPHAPDETSTVPLGALPPPKYKINQDNLQAAWVDFCQIVGSENVSTVQNDLDYHSSSEWSSHPAAPGERPFCVVSVGSTEETSRIMKVCHQRRIPVVGYSGGTSLEGHYTPTQGGICIDFTRMNRILALHENDLDVVVQPGVGWEALNDQLAKSNLFFPPDPGPGAMIGGMIGTGCSGTNAYRYGTIRDWVVSLTVVLADGTVIKTRQRPRKSSAGYDLTRMFIGSEGTLGLVTEATLKVTVRPASTSVAVCAFPSIRHAADCVAKVVGQGIPMAAIEILDDEQMKCINAAGTTSRSWAEMPTLFLKFAGTQQGVKEQIALVRKIASIAGSKTFDFAKSEDEQHELWAARKEALISTLAVKKEGDHAWTGDVAVPMSRLPDIIEETKESIRSSGLYGTIVGHVGDGNFHIILLYQDADRKAAEHVVHKMVKRAIELEGTVTGEHGVGLVKRDYLPHELGDDTVNAMRRLKLAFDPLCLLNPDKIIRLRQPLKGEVEPW